MKTIAWTLSARRALHKIPADVRERIERKLGEYRETGRGDATRLAGQPGARLRVGDYRAIFVETDDSIEVRAVGHRRDIYR